MQTFLPVPNFHDTAKLLDNKRLGKQRLEAIDCLKINLHLNYGISLDVLNLHPYVLRRYRNHPAREMWAGSEHALADYGLVICREWKQRGCVDNQEREFIRLSSLIPVVTTSPEWFNNPAVFASHRACLLFKNLDHYSRFGWTEQPTGPGKDGKWPYVWPIV